MGVAHSRAYGTLALTLTHARHGPLVFSWLGIPRQKCIFAKGSTGKNLLFLLNGGGVILQSRNLYQRNHRHLSHPRTDEALEREEGNRPHKSPKNVIRTSILLTTQRKLRKLGVKKSHTHVNTRTHSNVSSSSAAPLSYGTHTSTKYARCTLMQ